MKYSTPNGLTIVCSNVLYEKEKKSFLNVRELAEIYPGAKKYLKGKLKDEQVWLQGLLDTNYIYEIKKHSSSCGYDYGKEQEVNTARITHHQNQIDKSQIRIKRLKNILYFMSPRSKKMKENDLTEQIALAKEAPITSLLQFNNAGFAKCPFHNERTSSLKYYPQSNTFYCFGCAVGGDSITFVRKLHSLEFVEAVKYLVK